MTFTDMLTEDIQRLRAAEQEQLKTLPQMAESASGEGLQNSIREHLAQTHLQIRRLETVLEQMGAKPAPAACKAAEGLRDDAMDLLGRDTDDEVIDLEIIAAGQKTEHFEIACYSSAIEMCQALGMDQAVSLLRESLSEEQESSRILAQAAKPLLRTVAEMEMEEVEVENE